MITGNQYKTFFVVVVKIEPKILKSFIACQGRFELGLEVKLTDIYVDASH